MSPADGQLVALESMRVDQQNRQIYPDLVEPSNAILIHVVYPSLE